MRLNYFLKKLLCSLTLSVLAAGVAFAQTEIKGTVVDADGAPVIGAAVLISGTATGVVADIDGNFAISAKEGQTLEISCIGFKTQTVKITKAAVYSIVLEPDSTFLEEVVVVGYDVQKKVNLTGSVSSIGTDNFNRRPIVQVSSALQGLAAGVTVTDAGAAPGTSGTNIQIRGIGSFGGSDCSPLVLIDGVEGDMNAVDATQIDKISVLKDAASSSIYGNRAANGVILITTKRGAKGKGSVTYRGYAGWQTPVVYPSVANAQEYMLCSRLASDNDGSPSIYTDEYIANYLKNNYLDPDAYPITDWQKRLLTGDGFTHNHALSLRAGNDKIRVMTSFGYLSQDGIISQTRYQRYNLRNNMDVDISKHLSMKLDLSGSYGIRNSNPWQSAVFQFMNSKDPLMLGQWSDGSFSNFSGGTTNILPMIENGEGGSNEFNYLNLKGSLSLIYKPVKWFSIEGQVAPRYSLDRNHIFRDVVQYHADPYGTAGPTNINYNNLRETYSQAYNGLYQITARFNKNWNNTHDLKVILGASYEDYDSHSLIGWRHSFDYPEYQVLDAGKDVNAPYSTYTDPNTGDVVPVYATSEYSNSSTRAQRALGSFFGRVNYNYKERYLFEFNMRCDASSRFSKQNRWGFFPSFSAAWRISEENWMREAKNTLTELKLRASYGTLGNQNIGSNYPTAQSLTISSISAAGIIYPIVALNTLANPAISWETTSMLDGGIDLSLFNKVSFVGDVYFKKTNGILMKLDIPATIGLNAPYQNAGVVTNFGWEAAVNYNDARGDFSWGISANISDVINKIVDMKGTASSDGVIRNQEGYAINSIYGLQCLGMIKTQAEADWVNENCPQYGQVSMPGDLVYKDIAGAKDPVTGAPMPDGKIDDNDRTIIGCLIPRFTYGFTLNFGWKGLELAAQFQGVGKADGYMSGAYIQPCVSGGNFRKEHLDSWTPENPDAKFPRLSYTSDLNKKSSSFWMADASYLRLKNLQLSYRLPKKWMDSIKMGGIMFFVNATNLFTLSKYYQGYDPETCYQSGAQGATTGSIGNNYPVVSTYTFGVEINF